MDFFKPNNADKTLLDYLSNDSRSTLKELSNKLHISKQAISKKITFYDVASIASYISVIDIYKVGKIPVYIYFKLKNLEKQDYRDIFKKISLKIRLGWIAELFGDYDLAISFSIKDVSELVGKLDYIFRDLGEFIKDKKIIFVKKHIVLGYNFTDRKREIITLKIGKDVLKLSSIDNKILDLIEKNARFDYINLALKTGLNAQTIKKHIFNLQKNNIIKSYGLFLNYTSFGYDWKTCILDLTLNAPIKRIISFLSNEKKVPFVSVSIDNNIVFDFISQSPQELKIFLRRIKKSFDIFIKNYSLFEVNDVLQKPYT